MGTDNLPTQNHIVSPANNQSKSNRPINWLVWLLCLSLAFLFLLIATKSSPLYPLNDWTDPNTYFTLGKGMMNGRVPYRDLFEHKGPLLFFLHGLAYTVSHTSFLGVYLVEAIAFTLFLYFSVKALSLFVHKQYALLTLPFVTVAVLNMRSFAHGDTAEEFVLPFLVASLYYLLKYFKQTDSTPLPLHVFLINGILAGCVLWIKFSFLGFWIGWAAVMGLSMLLNRQFREALLAGLVFLGGMLAASLPWLAYFGLNRALPDFFETYFFLNLSIYTESLSLKEILRTALLSFRRHLYLNPISVSLMILGALVFLTHKKFIKNVWHRLGLLASIGALALGVYSNGKDYIYYFLIFSPFIILGLIVLADLYAESYGKIKSKILFMLLLFALTAGGFGYTLRFNRNAYMLDWQKADMVQYQFAATINQSENPTLLNYGFQDGGFYTVTGITPNVRFFEKYNLDYAEFPLNMDEQNRYIKDRLVEFVVIRLSASEPAENLPIPYLYDHYHLIQQQNQFFGETEYTYLLFRRTALP